MKTSIKVVLVVLIIISMFVVTIFAWIIPATEEALIFMKKEKIKEETEAAWGILSYFDSMVKQNMISLEKAQNMAAEAVAHMRYGHEMKDYFWINDLQPKMIMHPYRKDLNGQDLSEFRDPNGVAMFVKFVEVVRKSGAGFVSYMWQWKNDQTRIVPKISYVRLFRPWGWILGTGIYIEDVKSEIQSWRTQVTVALIIPLLIGIGLLWFIKKEVAEKVHFSADPKVMPKRGIVFRLNTLILIVVCPVLVTVTTFWFVTFYKDLKNVIIAGFDKKLLSISCVAGSFIKGEEHAKIIQEGDEMSEVYQKYIRPMKLILKKTNMTYLYSQILSDKKPYCFYILDSSEREDHTAIGEKDKLPIADYLGAENVINYGIVHIGDVQSTENWGLIKVSYAPIYNEDGSITAMAGADINLTIIKHKIRIALFAVSLLVLIALLGLGYIALVFSKKLTRPVDILKDGALMVAAGLYNHRISIDEPVEFNKLARAFNKIAETINASLKDLAKANSEIEERKQLTDLMSALDKSEGRAMVDRKHGCAFAWLNNKGVHKSASGWVANNNSILCWLAQSNIAPLDAVKLRSDIAIISKQLLERSTDDMEQFTAKLQHLFPENLRSFFIYQKEKDKLYYLPREPLDLIILEKNNFSIVRIEKKDIMKVNNDKSIMICDEPEMISESYVKNLNVQKRLLIPMIQMEMELRCGDKQMMLGIINEFVPGRTSLGL